MKKIWKDYRVYFISIYGLLSVFTCGHLFFSKMVPLKYIIGVFALLLIFFGVFYYLLFSKKTNKRNRILSCILNIILCLFMIIGNLYLFKATSTLNSIGTDGKTKIEISVIVMDDSSAQTINDISNGNFGISSVAEDEYVNRAINDINTEVGQSIITTGYNSYQEFGDSLYNGSVDAIIINEGTRGLFEEAHDDFNDNTRVIATYQYESEAQAIAKPVDVTSENFVLYISGIDTYGSLTTVARTDVNMLMVVNPSTKQILIVSIPRDYYIPQVCQGYQEDKLTHTGIFGVDCSVGSLEEFMGIDINYYARVNFSSIINIVDALGGVDVYSANSFVTLHGGYSIQQGTQHMNGDTALGFVRERYSLPGGDNDRVINQAELISAIIDKATSPAIITNYMGFMSSISGSFEVNLTNDEISSLIHMQLDDMSGWNITQYSLTGAGETNWSPANGFNSYVMRPDMNTVYKAQELIQQVKDGQIPNIGY